jgi:hypothetical protein
MMDDHLLCCWPVCTGASDSKQLWGNIGSGSPQPGLSSSRVRFLFNITWTKNPHIPYYFKDFLGACCGVCVYSSLINFFFFFNQHAYTLLISCLCIYVVWWFCGKLIMGFVMFGNIAVYLKAIFVNTLLPRLCKNCQAICWKKNILHGYTVS